MDYLRADLATWTKFAGDAKEHGRIRQTLRHWQQDGDLASIRESVALPRLPAEQREACNKLWADVADLLKKVTEKPPGRLDRKTDNP